MPLGLGKKILLNCYRPNTVLLFVTSGLEKSLRRQGPVPVRLGPGGGGGGGPALPGPPGAAAASFLVMAPRSHPFVARPILTCNRAIMTNYLHCHKFLHIEACRPIPTILLFYLLSCLSYLLRHKKIWNFLRKSRIQTGLDSHKGLVGV